MDIAALAAELTAGHPDTGAYNAIAVTAAAELNAVNRTTNKTSMSGDEVFSVTDNTEFQALSAGDKNLWLSFCGRDTINPFGASNVAFVTSLFGGGSDTLTALAATRKNDVSRAVELGLGIVRPGNIEEARA
jgi:hypothetical protein